MDFQKVIGLLKDKKEKEASKEMAKYLAEVKISQKDVGHSYAEIASAYLKANNYLLKNYNEFLKSVVGELQLLTK